VYAKGDGNGTITIEVGSMITDEIIEAKDESQARAILEEKFVKNDLTYNLKATLKTAWWGKLRELLGKDSFTLEISYNYYSYDIVEIGTPEEPDNNDGDGGETDYSWLLNTGYH